MIYFLIYYLISICIGFWSVIKGENAWTSPGSWGFVFIFSPVLVLVFALLLLGIYAAMFLLKTLDILTEIREALR